MFPQIRCHISSLGVDFLVLEAIVMVLILFGMVIVFPVLKKDYYSYFPHLPPFSLCPQAFVLGSRAFNQPKPSSYHEWVMQVGNASG